MGYYAQVDDVTNVRQIALIGIDTDLVTAIINGVEARVNSVLKAQGYPIIPATGETDKAMIKRQILQKAAVLCWTSVRGGDDLPAWIEVWNDEFEAWIEALEKGRIVLMDQSPATPGAPDRRVRMGRLRVLP
ncbi:MAG TPA: hypothetical protein PKD09_09210 [Aggregatilinea sp.]|uniref:hypothetical protein n=1 Tax=Aggregatilinea sp. TaxID=2806333 RepID=UPI002B694429|nr:hypothetical protein [Aggregatilinea sp.]HML21814.1 hypothetical protein [Aggregatilinea sp.]